MTIKVTITEISALLWRSSFTKKVFTLKAIYSFETSGAYRPMTGILFQKHGYLFHKITKYIGSRC
jgi:hypothetical protein